MSFVTELGEVGMLLPDVGALAEALLPTGTGGEAAGCTAASRDWDPLVRECAGGAEEAGADALEPQPTRSSVAANPAAAQRRRNGAR